MTIMSSTSLRNQYDEISRKCKETNEPIFISNDEEIDLVIMSIEAYEKREELLRLKGHLLDIELEQNNGAKTYTLDELKVAMNKIIGLK